MLKRIQYKIPITLAWLAFLSTLLPYSKYYFDNSTGLPDWAVLKLPGLICDQHKLLHVYNKYTLLYNKGGLAPSNRGQAKQQYCFDQNFYNVYL